DWDRAVVKPVLSASAHDATLVTPDTAAQVSAAIDEGRLRRPVMVQPFVDEIRPRGEWSLVFIDGALTHAVVKRPAEDDFRVQPRFGGSSIVADPPDGVAAAGHRVLDALPVPPLYARVESWKRLVEILRRTTIRGMDLATNLEFHYGVLMWFLARDPWAKPTTKFVVPYLTLVGEVAQEAHGIDLDYAFQQIARRATAAAAPDALEATRQVIELKETLLERPIRLLFDEPHFLSAWLSQHRLDYVVRDDRVEWQRNPVEVLAETYRLLEMDTAQTAAAYRIWDHDKELLDRALAFYDKLATRLPDGVGWPELDATLRSDEPAFGVDDLAWTRVRAAHAGHQLGLDILALLPLIAARTGFYDLRLEDDLTVHIPDRLHDPKHQEAMRKVLVPPPVTRADEIVAAMGGTFYAQEAPTLPPFLARGAHFDKGDPLYIIEVMKMFNKVYAGFAGTVTEVLVESGTVVRKGQPLFKIQPDEVFVEEDPAERERRLRPGGGARNDPLSLRRSHRRRPALRLVSCVSRADARGLLLRRLCVATPAQLFRRPARTRAGPAPRRLTGLVPAGCPALCRALGLCRSLLRQLPPASH
ncbi:MAG: hypothetical protein L0221_01920, partial [Chloroflexi bacterium]|nr:hypothetical protein [Chloroflexota bacterium]